MQIALPLTAAALLVLNRVANKVALVPMQPYLLFFALAQTSIYVIIYSACLLQQIRCTDCCFLVTRDGSVSQSMAALMHPCTLIQLVCHLPLEHGRWPCT
jgi:hypothetical protein